MRDHVNNMYVNGCLGGSKGDDYIRSLVFVKGNTQAFVYHDDQVDPNTYGVAVPASAPTGTSSVDPLDALDD